MGLRKWVQDNWVDIANKKSDGSYLNAEDQKVKKEKVIQNVYLLAKARSMSEGQRRSLLKENNKQVILGLNQLMSQQF
jgi:hypothetical protein